VDDNLRRQPSQDRSAKRFNLILDTAAQLIVERGLSGVTPTAIARESGMTGPAIYRYFTDMEHVLRALAARNLQRFFAAQEELLSDPDITWEDAVAATVDISAEMFRTEPSFARLRIGEGLDRNVDSTPNTRLRDVAVAAVELFQPRYGAWDRPLLVEHIEVIVQVVFALIGRAFESHAQGDQFFIDEAKKFAVSYLGNFLATTPGKTPDSSPAATA
jgi:AcrR family transcriptional regulator